MLATSLRDQLCVTATRVRFSDRIDGRICKHPRHPAADHRTFVAADQPSIGGNVTTHSDTAENVVCDRGA
jgi:hypothetical protein